MAITIDPDFLDQSREVYINTALRTFGIVIDTDVSPTQSPLSRIDSDGVSGQCVYSFFKEEWKNDAALIPYPFPMIAITPEQFEMLLAGNTCDSRAFREDFEIDLIPFESKALAYLNS